MEGRVRLVMADRSRDGWR